MVPATVREENGEFCIAVAPATRTAGILTQLVGIRQRGHPKKTWWDCVKNDMESLGLSQKDAQSRNKWRRRIKGATG